MTKTEAATAVIKAALVIDSDKSGNYCLVSTETVTTIASDGNKVTTNS